MFNFGAFKCNSYAQFCLCKYMQNSGNKRRPSNRLYFNHFPQHFYDALSKEKRYIGIALFVCSSQKLIGVSKSAISLYFYQTFKVYCLCNTDTCIFKSIKLIKGKVSHFLKVCHFVLTNLLFWQCTRVFNWPCCCFWPLLSTTLCFSALNIPTSF